MESITISKQEYLQLLRYKQIVSTIEDEIHEPEFKEDFIKKIEKIRNDMDKGKKIRFKSVQEMDNYLQENQ